MQDGLQRQAFSSQVSKITLMPRLNNSLEILDLVITEIKLKKSELRRQNQKFLEQSDEGEQYFKTVEQEKQVTFALESLRQIQKKIKSFTNIASIPMILPLTIQVIRTISCQLFEILPNSSYSLGELSSKLGGILMDSAIITEAKFDFRQYNLESNSFLDEAKLMVDSKISKLYPNLESYK